MLIGSLLVASFAIFGALYLAPGSALAALSGGRALPPASMAILDQRYHLNAPFFAQYWYWLDNALHGNRLWTTAGLGLYAILLICVIGIGFGVISGLRPGWLDTSALVTTAVAA